MQVPESDRHSETELHKEILHILLVLTTLQTIQTWGGVWGGEQTVSVTTEHNIPTPVHDCLAVHA